MIDKKKIEWQYHKAVGRRDKEKARLKEIRRKIVKAYLLRSYREFDRKAGASPRLVRTAAVSQTEIDSGNLRSGRRP